MIKSILTLALALSVLPISALADDNNGPPQMTDQQRQAMRQSMEQFKQQEEQLHEQMRSQILASLTPVHRRAVAAEIGNLVISPNPDPKATAERIDSILSPAERSRILSAHESFKSQEEQLHKQMMAQVQQQFPNWHPRSDQHQVMGSMQQRMNDAGWIVLHALPPHEHDMPGMPGH